MGRKKRVIFPSVQRILTDLGENIRYARLRRKFSAALIAQRAGISRTTLQAIERGEASVTFGAYVNVLFCLGLEKDLKVIAHDDDLGRKLQDVGLPIKARSPKLKAKKKTHE